MRKLVLALCTLSLLALQSGCLINTSAPAAYNPGDEGVYTIGYGGERGYGTYGSYTPSSSLTPSDWGGYSEYGFHGDNYVYRSN